MLRKKGASVIHVTGSSDMSLLQRSKAHNGLFEDIQNVHR